MIEEYDQNQHLNYYQKLLALEDVHFVGLYQDLYQMLTREEPKPEKIIALALPKAINEEATKIQWLRIKLFHHDIQ